MPIIQKHTSNIYEQIALNESETARLFKHLDWKNHPLGPLTDWPLALKVTLSNLFHSLQPMLILWGPEHFQFYNDACIPYLGKGRHPQSMGKRSDEVFKKDWEIIKDEIADVLTKGHAVWKENIPILPAALGLTEAPHWTYGISPIFTEDGHIGGVLTVGHQTRQYSVNEMLNQAKNVSRLKTAFLANISHEIRTPLGAIVGFANILKTPELSAEDRDRYINIISRNGTALTRLIDDILDLSHVEAGNLEIEKVPLNLKKLTQEIIGMFADRASAKGIALHFAEEDFPPFNIDSDPPRIRQILVNLIGNAIKFTSKGSVSIHSSFNKVSSDMVAVRVTIKDTGIGLDTHQAAELFTLFSQADGKSTRKFGGTGLGLALSRKLARALGGDVTLDFYELHHGCSFSFEIVAKRSFELPAKPPLIISTVKMDAPSTLKRLAGIRVLVVDDTIDNRHLIQIFLHREGAEVDLACDGETGVNMACSHEYDAVLMDIQMPGIDGYEALAKLKQQHYTKPVIAITAHAFLEEKIRAMKAGFSDHLAKPISPNGLTQSLLEHTRH